MIDNPLWPDNGCGTTALRFLGYLSLAVILMAVMVGMAR